MATIVCGLRLLVLVARWPHRSGAWWPGRDVRAAGCSSTIANRTLATNPPPLLVTFGLSGSSNALLKASPPTAPHSASNLEAASIALADQCRVCRC